MRIRCRGSFTVEAVFLYPIMVILLAFMLSISINWYQNIRTTAADTEELVELDTLGKFLEAAAIESLAESIADR